MKSGFQSKYSTLEILLLAGSKVERYNSINFKPPIQLTKENIIDASRMSHGVAIGYFLFFLFTYMLFIHENTFLDIEGQIVMDRGIIGNASNINSNSKRRSIKVKDETSSIDITFWNMAVSRVFIQKNLMS